MAEALDLLTPYFPVYATPEESSSSDIPDPDISAILGGSVPILKPDEGWPRCMACNEPLIPYIQVNISSPQTPQEFRERFATSSEPGTTRVFQVFVCVSENECLTDTLVTGDPDGGAWLIRVLHVSTANRKTVEEMRDGMGSDVSFISERIITHWTAGRPEVEHDEVNWHLSTELYQQHEPAWGLKLLGWPIRGALHPSCIRL